MPEVNNTFEVVANEWYGTLTLARKKSYDGYRQLLNAVIKVLNEMGGCSTLTLGSLNLPDSFRDRVDNRRQREILNRVLKYGAEQNYWDWELTLPPKPEKVILGKWSAFVIGKYPKEGADKWKWMFRGPKGILEGLTMTREEAVLHLAKVSGAQAETLKDLMETYVGNLNHIQPGTRKTYLASVGWILDTLGDVPLGTITPEHMLLIGGRPGAEAGTMGNKNNAGKGARQLYRRFWVWAHKQGHTDQAWYTPAPVPTPVLAQEPEPAPEPTNRDIPDVVDVVGTPQGLNTHITVLEYDYITSRLADPEQSVNDYLTGLVHEDSDSMQPYRVAAVSYEPLIRVPLPLTEDERAWLDLRLDGKGKPSLGGYIRGLLHLKMYGAPCIEVAIHLNCSPEQATKLALNAYHKNLIW